jgi:hypothetical protein
MLQNVVTWLIVKRHVVESNHIVRQTHYFLSFKLEHPSLTSVRL